MKKPMTLKEALEEAQRRWGPDGRAWRRRYRLLKWRPAVEARLPLPEWVYFVGRMVPQFNAVDYRLWNGQSVEGWKAAFADADRRAGGPK